MRYIATAALLMLTGCLAATEEPSRVAGARQIAINYGTKNALGGPAAGGYGDAQNYLGRKAVELCPDGFSKDEAAEQRDGVPFLVWTVRCR